MQHPTLRHSNHEMFASLRRWTRREGRLEEPLPLEMTIAAMDEGGVSVGLAAAWYGPEGSLIDNDEVAGFVARYPDRLRGAAGADLRRPMEAVRELRRRAEEGFVALRVVPWLWELPPTDRHYYPLYAACVDLDIPFCTQVGHTTGPLRPSETGRPIPYIDQVALDFPELTVVCGHIGYPWTTEMIAVADKHPNVYIDTSAYAAHRYPPELVEYMKGRGARKVLFGTNYPMLTSAQALAQLERLGLGDEQRDLFLYAAHHQLSVRTAWTDWGRLVQAGWLAPTQAPANQGPGRRQGSGSGRAARYVLTVPAALVDQLRPTSLVTFPLEEASPSPSVPPARHDHRRGWITLQTPTVTERRDASALPAGCHPPWRRQPPDHALLTRTDWQQLLPLVATVQAQRPEMALTAVLTDRVASARHLPNLLAWRLWRLLRTVRPQESHRARPPSQITPPDQVGHTDDWHHHLASPRRTPSVGRRRYGLPSPPPAPTPLGRTVSHGSRTATGRAWPAAPRLVDRNRAAGAVAVFGGWAGGAVG